jgi:glutaminase
VQTATATPSRPLDGTINDLYDRIRAEASGDVATYIPELAKANPNWFGLCLSTLDGTLYSAGDTQQTFTIQSISKPFVYAMALEHVGPAEVAKRVGVEPSGEAFNSISLEPATGRPLNPMINAGAIAMSSLIYQHHKDDSLERMLEWFSSFAGRPVTVDHRVYRSESSTGHRNRAIAHLLRNFNIVGDPVEAGLDLYFQQCSILVTAQDLAIMGATLANRGINPRTGQRAISLEYVDDMLSLMTTCGMYDYAGQWLYDVGLPAKSGVAGGIMAMLPGRMGIGSFSPKLDIHGNSVRGIMACKELSDRFRLHLFAAGRPARSVIRRQLTLEHRHSQRVRSTDDTRKLKSLGSSVVLFELQGDLEFDGMETLGRQVTSAAAQASHIVLDFSRIDYMDSVAITGIEALIANLASADRQIALTGRLPRELREYPAANLVCYASLDEALEACEDSLLTGRPISELMLEVETELRLEELELGNWLTPDELHTITPFLERREYKAGDRLLTRGDPSGGTFYIAKGVVAVRRELEPGQVQTLARLGRGTVFGEISAIDRGPRSSDVWAVSDVVCYVMPLEEYDRLGNKHPDLSVRVLKYFVSVLTARLRNANEQIAALAV